MFMRTNHEYILLIRMTPAKRVSTKQGHVTTQMCWRDVHYHGHAEALVLCVGSCDVTTLYKAFLVVIANCCLSRGVLTGEEADGSLIARTHATEARQEQFGVHNNDCYQER
jgi:hypothetical protein